MNEKRRKSLNRIILAALLIAIAAVFYFTSVYRADELRIVDGKVEGAKPTWLIGRVTENGAETYVKLGDVNNPAGYKTDKETEDPDGDSITTFFAFVGKDPEKNPGKILVTAVSGTAGEMPGEAYEWTGAEKSGDRVISGTLAQQDGEAAFYMPSPYEDTCIEVRVSGMDDPEEALALLRDAAAKVVPGKQVSQLEADIKLNFIDDSRWSLLANGLLVTLEITLVATLLGIVIGVAVATVRSTWDQNNENMRPSAGKNVMGMLNSVCKFYLTVIRGTPMVIQLMIMYYIIFASSRNGVLIAMLAFGINSGAYVAEIIRGGIMSVDRGQLEAGRSLGFNYVQTMWHIIIPQAMKSVLPALANEFIVLLKETSVAGYVAVKDLTKGGDLIRGVTYSPFMPLIAVALIYLVMVMFFTWLVGKLERRLRASDH